MNQIILYFSLITKYFVIITFLSITGLINRSTFEIFVAYRFGFGILRRIWGGRGRITV